jgi:hypothetical protein
MYGSSYDECKLDFINELHNIFALWDGPTLIGGDFSLIEDSKDKNNGVINQHWAIIFNDWVNKFGLFEIKNAVRKLAWENN